jgi:hypothetical protein
VSLLPKLAHRVISVRCGIWSLSGHSGHPHRSSPIYEYAPWKALFSAASGVQRNPAPGALRVKPNLLSQFNLICPVQSHLEKYFASPLTQISNTSPPVPSHRRGGSRSSRTRGGMRWTLMALSTRALTRTAKSCGPDAPTLASSLRKSFRKRRWQTSPVTGESAKETVKTTARGMPGVSGVTVVTNSRVFYTTREAAGASSARHSLRPLLGERFMHNPGGSRRGIANVHLDDIARSQRVARMRAR